MELLSRIITVRKASDTFTLIVIVSPGFTLVPLAGEMIWSGWAASVPAIAQSGIQVRFPNVLLVGDIDQHFRPGGFRFRIRRDLNHISSRFGIRRHLDSDAIFHKLSAPNRQSKPDRQSGRDILESEAD